MKIIKKKDGISVSKADGTDVIYHLFPEYEIHYNEIAPGAEQQWHHHKKIEEVLFIISGSLEARWIEDRQLHILTVSAGDVVRVENKPHTFANIFPDKAIFSVFRFVPDGSDKRDIIKNDKYLDDLNILID